MATRHQNKYYLRWNHTRGNHSRDADDSVASWHNWQWSSGVPAIHRSNLHFFSFSHSRAKKLLTQKNQKKTFNSVTRPKIKLHRHVTHQSTLNPSFARHITHDKRIGSEKSGSSCKGLDWTAQQIGFRIFHVQRALRTGRFPNAIEQRQNSYQLAIRRAHEYHIQWGNSRGWEPKLNYFLRILCIFFILIHVLEMDAQEAMFSYVFT